MTRIPAVAASPASASPAVAASPASAFPASAFPPLPPSDLPIVLADPHVLIIDIRPHNAHASARVPSALSLSVPSTLLKRPTYSLAKLAYMLPSVAARTRFATWPTASRIVVYDPDAPALVDRPALLGLLRKFRAEGFTRDLVWIRGGFHAVWRERPDLVDRAPLPEEEDDADDISTTGTETTKSVSAPATTLSFSRALRTKHLPMSAFTSASTQRVPPTPFASMPRGVPQSIPEGVVPPTPLAAIPDPFASVRVAPPVTRSVSVQPGSGSFALRLPPMARSTPPSVPGAQSMPTPSPQTYSIPGQYEAHHSAPPTKQVAYNPFFDAIRQNLELGRGADRDAGIALCLPRRVRRRVGDLPFEWLRQIARRSGREEESSSSESSSASSTSSSSEDERGHKRQRQRRLTRRRTPRSSSPEHAHMSESPPDADELTRALERQFYRIELGEQKRLMNVMEHHTGEGVQVQNVDGRSVVVEGAVLGGVKPAVSVEAGREEKKQERREVFPFSITAGLEKGAKNRYRNIWPFEHARVRLRKARPEDDDYMNASYVQPLGTTKRYIATQGPLPATFNDFWTLCWEQNVHVIVMLTREVEGATVKCGKYWAEGMYGPLRLRLLTTDDTPEREQRRRDAETSGGFFGAHVQSTMTPRGKHRKARDHHHRSQNDSRTQSDSDSDRTTIRRVFELTHTGYPDAPSRNVTQLQYLDWPDFNVPEDPRGLLGLMREVDDVAERARGAGDKQWGEGPSRSGPWRASADTRGTSTGGAGSDVEPTTGVACHASGNPPVLLHCSAGVGRTGGFIAVDAVLDSVRREMRKRKESQGAAASTSAIPDGGGGYSTSKPSDGEGSASRSSSREAEAMEVDPSPSPSEAISSGAARLENSTLTVPVSVGQNEVHVPVAGFTGPIAMDVDDAKYVAHSGRHGNVQPVRSSILPATPELVNEVRRVAFNRHSSISTSIPSTVAPETTMSSRSSESGSDSGAARSGSRSGSGGASASELHSRSLSSSPPSSLLGSSTSLSAVVSTKAAEIPLQENLGPQNSGVGDVPAVAVMDSRTRRLSLPAPMSSPSKRPKFAEDTANTAESTHASRLDTWRSEVRTSGSPPRDDRPPLTSVELPQFAQGLPRDDVPASQSGASHRGRTYDYPHPRRLHEDVSPPVLSIYDEPIRRVVEDMREQRMSLCQSLRQYVFVHRAVIEGALMIVDDEREKERAVQRAGGIRAESRRVTAASDRAVHGTKGKVTEEPEQSLSNSLFGSGLGHGLGTPIVLNEKDSPRLRRMSHGFSGGVPVDLTSSIAPMHSPGRSKRGASPTELLKEGTQGEVVLTKRPSVKRRQRYEDDTPVEFEPILLSSPSQVPPGSR